MSKSKCPKCGSYKKPWFKVCYNCHMQSRKDLGVIRSVICFIWMPAIPAILGVVFFKAFVDLGIPAFPLFLFIIVLVILLIVDKIQEIENIKKQWKKRNIW